MKTGRIRVKFGKVILACAIAFTSVPAHADDLQVAIICAKKMILTRDGVLSEDFLALYEDTKHSHSIDPLEKGQLLYLPPQGNLSDDDFEKQSNNHSKIAHRLLMNLLNSHAFGGFSNNLNAFRNEVVANGALIESAPNYQNLSCFYLFTSEANIGVVKANLRLERALVARVVDEESLSELLPEITEWKTQIEKDPTGALPDYDGSDPSLRKVRKTILPDSIPERTYW